MEIMLSRYKELANFLGAWFPEADMEGLTDEQVVSQFSRVAPSVEIAAVRQQLDDILSSGDYNPEEIGREANRYFSSREECASWLQSIRLALRE